MDVVVTGRHCEITDRYRSHVEEKLTRLEKHDHRIMRVQVEVDCEANPRQRDRAVRIELTAFSKGPVIRAEAAAADKMAALDLALDKMAAQMRRAADRRRVHHGRHAPVSVGQALADVDEAAERRPPRTAGPDRQVGPIAVDRRRPAGRPREDPPGQPDDARPGALRDGAGRPRLLPVRGQGERAALGRLPPSRLRLRRHLARRRPEPAGRTSPPQGVPGGRVGRAGWPIWVTPARVRMPRPCPRHRPLVS